METILIALIAFIWLSSGIRCIISFNRYNKAKAYKRIKDRLPIYILFLLGGWLLLIYTYSDYE